MRLGWLPLLVPLCGPLQAQRIITEDIPRFWEAYDALATAKDRADSVACFQRLYLDRASEGLKRFMKVRDLGAEHFADAAWHSAFWSSIRPNTLRIQERETAINAVLDRYERELPGFTRPQVCFAIGRLSTGGTVSGSWILIGSEIVCADSTTDTHELSSWLRSAMRPTDQSVAFVAHEAVHTRQRIGPRAVLGMLTNRLRTQALMEGTADLVAREVAGVSINEQLQAYGLAHEDSLWREFQAAMRGNDTSQWLYQGPASKDRPADLGYFMGERIAAAFYTAAADKNRALRVLLRTGSAGKVVRRSGYAPGSPAR
ncbi:MAG TPA: hypothetical protein PKJ19_10525 [Flavobacteriales bacterium]|nr:hypothetical protein [Flavobacteriales bacterium]